MGIRIVSPLDATYAIWEPCVALLLSLNRDGYILIHKLTANFTTVQLHKRFKIVKERNPVENAKPRSAEGTCKRAAEAGLYITSFDFSPGHPSIFIVRTLCGGIYKCSFGSITFIEGDATIIDPVIDKYEKDTEVALLVSITRHYVIYLSVILQIKKFIYIYLTR